MGQLTEANGGGVVYNYTYTPNGNVMDKLVNGGKALSYTYTASGKVAGITDKSGKATTYAYDKAGRVTAVKDNGNLVVEYHYYEDGTIRQVKFANGVETNYTYNADKNYKNIVTKTAEGEILLDYSYAYDGNGNRTRKTGADHVTKHCGNDSSVGITTYAYDSLQRLQEVSYPTGKVEQFQYDNAGNRALKKYGTAENFKTGNYLEERYQYDNRNRLLERKNPQDVTYYQYDKQGNTVSELTKRFLKPETVKTQNGSITTVSSSLEKTELEQYKTYEYNAFNQASKVVVENYQENSKEIHVQENFYDAENLRYGIEEDNVRTNFVTNGWSVFTELDAEWKPTKRLVRGYGIVASEDIGIATITDRDCGYSNGYHYYHQNEHGDIEYITGKDGKVENAYTYDAFGNITNSQELIKNRYTYNGEQYDKVTEQYYLRARYYNPLVERFTQEDVYRGDGLNLYAYCGNNPVMYMDPSGYAESKCGIGKDNKDSASEGGNSSRPGGYISGDVDKHGLLSPSVNRASGNHNTKSENQIQSHHPVQDAWAKKWEKKNGISYDRNEAAAILLPSNSGMSHAKISAAQRARRRIEGFDTSIGYEFNVGYREMIDAGVNQNQARKAMRKAYKYFDLIGAFDIR